MLTRLGWEFQNQFILTVFALAQPDDAVDQLAKMLRLRGKSVQADLLATMNTWLR
jgi:hypothetical protein